jgi:hypothetical protein
MAITTETRGARGLRRTDPPAAASVDERAKAFAEARRHSVLVRLLRIALPLAAACILAAYALVLMVSWQLSVGRIDVGGIVLTADDLTMKDPSYFGVAKGGGHYQVRARRAIVAFNQDGPIKLIDIGGNLVQADRATTRLKAKHGLFDNAKGELDLFDGIEIDGSSGLMARLSRAKVYSRENKVVSKHPVSATMPTGSVQAAGMTMNTKTRFVQFRGTVAVRLLPSAMKTSIGAGRDARQPVDIYSEELDVDDMQKTAHFRGKVVAMQGQTMLSTPYLFIKYEGKAAATLGSGQATQQGEQGTRVTFVWARNGVEITAGGDRQVKSDLADFDMQANTALFAGNVVVTQNKNVLKGARLFVDRQAGKSRLEPAEGEQSTGRIAATFYQSETGSGAKRSRSKPAADSLVGSFKTDPTAPMEVEANSLDVFDASGKAIFKGNVSARQGDFVVRTAELTAFYTGRTGLGMTDTGDAGDAAGQGKITRLEARRKVIITSSDERRAIAEWANFDVQSNTALLGGGVVVVRGKDIAEGPRLKIDLTTGMYRFETDAETSASEPAVKAPAIKAPIAKAPASEDRTCPPGKQCMLFYPKDAKDKAKDVLKKAPRVDAH